MTGEEIDILIVDDDMDIRQMMQSILKFHGYKVQVCADPEQMYKSMKKGTPALILMDMLLSGFDGREVCKNLKSSADTKKIPVLMISAHPDAERTCKQAGADSFLEKPFDIETFLNKVNALLLSEVHSATDK